MEQLVEIKNIIFWAGLMLLASSIFFHAFAKSRPAIILLVFAGFLFFVYAAVTIPVLNVWDERFHALVAKNLMKHPLMPTLYDQELLKLPYGWAQSHIWVHKQPLFLWQAALSYRLFGVNEFAFRLPGILLCTVLIYAAYRTGKLLRNSNAGYYTAFLIATSLYVEQLISGFAPIDQNDLVFMAYISLSIWAIVEYLFSKKFYWVILTGLFAGFALLTKEAVGLLVYLIWFVYALLKYKMSIKEYRPIIISVIISLLIFIPWQVYIFNLYPVEAKTEFQFNMHHFTQVIDGQEGPFSFHFKFMGLIFGSLVPFVIIPALIIFYLKSSEKKLGLAIIFSLLFIYIFFSFAKTKMQSFTTVAEVPMYLALAFLIDFILESITQRFRFSPGIKATIVVVFLLGLAGFRFDFNSLKANHGFWGKDVDCCNTLIRNKGIFQKLKLPDNSVLCNVPGRHYVEAMYYTNYPAYGFIPNESQSNELRNEGKRIVLFSPVGKLPDYLLNDKGLIILKDSLGNCE